MWSSEITSGWIIIPDRVFIHTLQFQLAALIPQHFNPKYWCFRYFTLQDSCTLPLVVYYKIQTSIINPCSTRFTPRNITANTSFTANDGKIWLEDICKDRLVPLGVWERICQIAFSKAHSCLSCSSIHCLVIIAVLHQKYRITAWPSGV